MHRPLAELRGHTPRRVCIIKPSSLGDIVHALPVLAALRELWPGAHVAWVVNRSFLGLVEGHPLLDEVVVHDRSRVKLGGAARFARLLGRLRRGGFDLTIDLQGLLRSGLMTAATAAPVRVGQGFTREGAALFYTHQVPLRSPEPHAVDRLLDVARAFGAPISEPRFVLAVSEADRRWAREILSAVPRPRVLLNLGARWPTKRWPVGHFAEVARRVVERRGAGLVAVGAPEDAALVAALRADLHPVQVLDLSGRTTLPQLAALAEESDVFLSNDTGPLHLAAAAGTRVVGIYTCTSPELTGPYGPRAAVVRSGVWCAPSYVTTCGRLECMAELSPDRVWQVVADQLDGRTPTAGGQIVTTIGRPPHRPLDAPERPARSPR